MPLPLRSAFPLLALLAACSSSAKTPAVASAGGHAAYAVRYDEELGAANKAFADAQAREKALSAGLAAYVDQMKRPDWQRVEIVIDDSDEAGRSADFADASNDATAIRSFWEADKGEISARVNASAQEKLKESGCPADVVAGPIAYAMNDAINKRLQKRLRAHNDAFVVIERYRTALGPQNVAPLEKLADDVSEASYDVHVLMLLQRTRLQRLVADRSDVKKTLDRYVQEETDFQAEPGRTDAEKKSSADRIATANKHKAEIDNVAAQAEAVSKEMDKSIEAATKDYDDAIRAIKAKVADRKKTDATTRP